LIDANPSAVAATFTPGYQHAPQNAIVPNALGLALQAHCANEEQNEEQNGAQRTNCDLGCIKLLISPTSTKPASETCALFQALRLPLFFGPPEQEFANAECTGRLGFLQQLHGAHPDAIRHRDTHGGTVLHHALANCQSFFRNGAETIAWLCCLAPDLLMLPSKEGVIPLHSMLRLNETRILSNINAARSKMQEDKDSNSMFVAIRILATAEAVSYRVPADTGRYVDGKTQSCVSALHIAARASASSVILRFLHAMHPSACAMGDNEGMLPLHVACATENTSPEAVETLYMMHKEAIGIPHKPTNDKEVGLLPLQLAMGVKWKTPRNIISCEQRVTIVRFLCEHDSAGGLFTQPTPFHIG
jgi:hypothetical protein